MTDLSYYIGGIIILTEMAHRWPWQQQEGTGVCAGRRKVNVDGELSFRLKATRTARILRAPKAGGCG